MIFQKEISLPPMKRGFHLIDEFLLSAVGDLPEVGLLNVFVKHTSAALTINENYDPDVRLDMEKYANVIVKENIPGIRHTMEGADDMPAHFKSSMIGQSLTIPVTDGKLNLGTWQGVYLCEFRNNGGNRRLVLTVYR